MANSCDTGFRTLGYVGDRIPHQVVRCGKWEYKPVGKRRNRMQQQPENQQMMCANVGNEWGHTPQLESGMLCGRAYLEATGNVETFATIVEAATQFSSSAIYSVPGDSL
jgi:hypothetical protein